MTAPTPTPTPPVLDISETIERDVPCGGLTERVSIHLIDGEVRGWSIPAGADTNLANMLRRYCKGFSDGVQYCRDLANDRPGIDRSERDALWGLIEQYRIADANLDYWKEQEMTVEAATRLVDAEDALAAARTALRSALGFEQGE